MATINTFAYDSVAGVPSYTSGNIIDWMYQISLRSNGVIPGSDSGLAVSTDGTGNVLTQNGVSILGGRSAVLTAGPQTTSLGTLPANGFRTAYAIVMRYNTSTQSTSIVSIAGSTIANPGPAVNPSIVALTDILLAYVLAVNTGSIAYTTTDARTYTTNALLTPTGTITYSASDLGVNAMIIAPITAAATINITAGSIYQGNRIFIKNTSAGAFNITLHFSATIADIILSPSAWIYLQWDGSTWSVISSSYQYAALTTGSSPYSLSPFTYNAIGISATTNPYVFNLPQASTCAGYKVNIINTSALATGLIKIVPFSGDKIGPMANNVAAYLQNVDQSGWMNQQQNLEIISNGTSWVVTGGQLMPEPGSVDAAGTQYFLGKLRHLPLNNASSRLITNQIVPPAQGAWSSAQQATGSFGIPSGAKAIRVKAIVAIYATTATAQTALKLAFSDNNSNTPSESTGHPYIGNFYSTASAGGVCPQVFEIDVPLNSSGQFYIYDILNLNTTLANDYVSVTAVGYYMGD